MGDHQRSHAGLCVRQGRGCRGGTVGPSSPALTVLEILRRSTTWLEGRGIESPRLDVEILMAHALGVKRLDLYLQFDRPLADGELDVIRDLIRRRGTDESVAYLTGEREFFSLPFRVDSRVLVPRPETEHLVEVALAALKGRETPAILDVGTGSGCVAVSLLHEMPAATAVATDVSSDAIAVARANAEANGVHERLSLVVGDLLGGQTGPFDAVVSNPPYIVKGDESVQSGVDAHEPAQALYVSGDDPLEFVRRLAEEAPAILAPGGLLAIEVGFGGAQESAQILRDAGFESVTITKDLGGIERIVSGVRLADSHERS